MYQIHGYVSTTHVTTVTTYDWIITYPGHSIKGHGSCIMSRISNCLYHTSKYGLITKSFSWTIMIKVSICIISDDTWFYHRYRLHSKFRILIIIGIFHYMSNSHRKRHIKEIFRHNTIFQIFFFFFNISSLYSIFFYFLIKSHVRPCHMMSSRKKYNSFYSIVFTRFKQHILYHCQIPILLIHENMKTFI